MRDARSICFVSPFALPLLTGEGAGPGGAERQFFLIGRALAGRGWRVHYITAPPPGGAAERPASLPVSHVPFRCVRGSPYGLPADWALLMRAMHRANTRYHVLKTPGHLLAPMSLLCRMKRQRLVFWGQADHDADTRRNLHGLASKLQDWGLRRANVVIAQNEGQRKGFWESYGIRADIVPSIYAPLEETGPGAAPEAVDVLWVGNSSANKRPSVVAVLAGLMPTVRFAVAMNCSNRGIFQRTAEALSHLPNVRFLGTVPHAEMEKWFAVSRVVLNTSIIEGFPNVYLQAWANRTPVVSLNIDPDRLLSEHGLGVAADKADVERCGEDPLALARLLRPLVERFLEDESVRLAAGKRGEEYVQSRHTPDRVVPAFIRVLERAG